MITTILALCNTVIQFGQEKKNAYAYATYKTQICSVGVSVYALNAYLHFKIEIAQFNDE